MFDKLKKRWGVKTTFQVITILFVFTITGSTIVFIKKPFFEFLGYNFYELGIWAKILYYIFILPLYFALLIVIGYIFGQGQFFIGFVRKFLQRFSWKSKERSERN